MNNYFLVGSLPTEFQDVRLDNKYLIPYLNKLKRKDFPSSPKTVYEVISAFQDEEKKKLYGKYYVCTENPNPNIRNGFTILCDQRILEIVAKIPNREILIDGTFEIVKRGPYSQLLVMHLAYEQEVNNFDFSFWSLDIMRMCS